MSDLLYWLKCVVRVVLAGGSLRNLFHDWRGSRKARHLS